MIAKAEVEIIILLFTAEDQHQCQVETAQL